MVNHAFKESDNKQLNYALADRAGLWQKIDNFFPTSTDRQEVSQNTKITLDVTQKSCQLTNDVATCVGLSKVEQTIIVHKVGLVSSLTFNSFCKFSFQLI